MKPTGRLATIKSKPVVWAAVTRPMSTEAMPRRRLALSAPSKPVTRRVLDKWASKQEDKPNRSDAIRRLVDAGAEGEEMTFATHPERQFMQYLRGAGWIKARFLPKSTLVENLLRKGWIEQQQQGPTNEVYFRLTEKGLEAKKSAVPTGRAGLETKESMAGLRRYVEWMTRGRRTERVAYVTKQRLLPKPLPGAEWQLDTKFIATEEILRDPELKTILKAALEKGVELSGQPERITQRSA